MKIQIRQGAFETNSSSEHSLVISSVSDYNQWLEGKVLARVIYVEKGDCDNGNSDGFMYHIEITNDFEKAATENREKIKKFVKAELDSIESYKKECLKYKKRVERKLSSIEISKLSRKEKEKYELDVFEDQLHTFNKSEYDRVINFLNNISDNNYIEEVGFEDYWITFEQFKKAFMVDCASDFIFQDPKHDVVIIGKYFHS